MYLRLELIDMPSNHSRTMAKCIRFPSKASVIFVIDTWQAKCMIIWSRNCNFSSRFHSICVWQFFNNLSNTQKVVKAGNEIHYIDLVAKNGWCFCTNVYWSGMENNSVRTLLLSCYTWSSINQQHVNMSKDKKMLWNDWQ